jgi:PEP-CTERM motif
MRNFKFAAAAFALAVPAISQAAPFVTATFPSVATVPANNDFQAKLNALGLYNFASTGADLVLSGDAKILFYFMGSESGLSDTFTAGSVTYTESTSMEDHFSAPIYLGFQDYAAGGSLAGLWNFTGAGVNATVGQFGFGIFLPENFTSGMTLTDFYIGYDDIPTGDDNHDDFIVHAIITAVPEPGTWAMLLAGFTLIGSLMRRRRSNGITVLA